MSVSGKNGTIDAAAAAPAYAGSVFFKSQLLSQFQRILNVDVDLNAKLDGGSASTTWQGPMELSKEKRLTKSSVKSYSHHEDVS